MSPSDSLRSDYQWDRRRSDSEGCPSAPTLSALAADELDPEERGRTIEHLAGCSDCAHEYRVVEDLLSLAEAAGGPRPRPAVSRWLGWAAALLIVFGLGQLVGRDALHFDHRESFSRGSTASIELVEPTANGRLAEAPERFRWSVPASDPRAGHESTQYQVVLYSIDGAPVWRSAPTPETSADLPEAVRAELVGGDYLWRVLSRTGVARSASAVGTFSVEAE